MGYNDAEEGIVPRFSQSLFDKVAEIELNNTNIHYSVEISFYEIYNEKIYDLMEIKNDGNRQRLCVREHPDMGPYVQGLSMHVVRSLNDIQNWLEVGNKNRATAATGMNDKSSRSHSVFTIVLTEIKNEMFEGNETQLQKTSKINLIDLAGSERANQVYDERLMKDSYTANTRLKEGGCINKSLHTLGKVISLLSESQINPKKRNVYIPYRDSVLTWLLKESLGGNARTAMLATISPSCNHYNETLSTLRYAHQARLIVNKARVNEDPKSKLIREMLYEIERLKSCQVKTGDKGNALENEVLSLREKLSETRSALALSARNWQEKLESSEKKQKEASKHLRRSGISFTKLETKNPCLVNLNEDPQLAEVLLYIIHKGTIKIGSDEPDNDRDIQLWGDLISANHCSIEFDGDIIALIASENAPTYVNGILVSQEITLHHGDRLVIGGDHFFRLNYPKEAFKNNVNTNSEKSVKGFEYAKEELFRNQNERLYAELEEAKLKAEEEAMEQIKEAQAKAENEMTQQKELFLKNQQMLECKLKASTDEKRAVEQVHQNAQQTIEKLVAQKKILEDEILSNQKSLQMEALAAKKALKATEEDNMKIIEELEREKMKMAKDIEAINSKKKSAENTRSSLTILVNNQPKYIDVSMQQDLLALSLMLREANTISEKIGYKMVFSREDLYGGDGDVEHRIRMTNVEMCKSTVIDLATFGDIVTQIREITQNNGVAKKPLMDENRFHWVDDQSCKRKARLTRMSLSNSSLLMSLNKSLDMSSSNQRNDSVYESTAISNNSVLTKSGYMTDDDALKLSCIPNESTIVDATIMQETKDSSAFERSTDISNLKTSMFETFLNDFENEKITSIIARLTHLIFTVYTDWNNLVRHGNNFSNTSMIEDDEQLMLRLACNMKSIRELSYTLCKVHEAVGLDQLKDMSCSFKDNVQQACSVVKSLGHTIHDSDSTKKFEKLMMFMIEVAAALSLASVDHFESDNDETYLDKEAADELCVHFLRHQNRFLLTMIDEAMSTVISSVEVIKNLQLTCSHEMSDDLVDGVMNILISVMTLLHTCKDLLTVHSDANTTSEIRIFYSKECLLLREFLTSIVDYNENIYNMTEHSKEIAKNCDNAETFLDIPIELADTTKNICSTGKELLLFVSQKKQLDNDTFSLLQECYDKFEFAGKAVRVGVTIVVQEIEKDLNINEQHSVLSVVQSDESLTRLKSMCPLNRTSLDTSSMSGSLQNSLNQSRRSSIRPDLFISRYMDSTISIVE